MKNFIIGLVIGVIITIVVGMTTITYLYNLEESSSSVNSTVFTYKLTYERD